MTISRRRFAQLLGASAAAAVARPALGLSQTTPAPEVAKPAGLERLDSNENPYGPSPKALQAMSAAFPTVNRYPDAQADPLLTALAKVDEIRPDQILLGAGSSEILKLCADVFTGPAAKGQSGGALVAADPTFEAVIYHADRNGAQIVKIPLTKSYAHDLPRMQEAAARAGLVYLCNPNNPTASITPKKAMRDFIAQVPEKTIILVDEAYHHYVDDPDYASMMPLVKEHPNLIVTRTFSKIYALAGARCGYGAAQSYTIERLRARQSWDSVNVLGMAAAKGSLDDAEKVPLERRRNAEIRGWVVAELKKMGFSTIPSQANFIMLDAKRPVIPVLASLKYRKVKVGRFFRALPNHLRVTIGTQPEMEAFLAAFRRVVA